MIMLCRPALYMMGLFLELVMSPLVVTKKLLALLKFYCQLGVQIFIFASATWLLLVKAVLKAQVDACWNVAIWAFSIVWLPIRILTALQREKLLERKLHEMQSQLDNLMWENKELDERLNISFEERRAIELVLLEMEQEQGKALEKIDQLENELQDLKDENLQLNEFQGKSLWDYQGQYGKVHDGIPLGTNYGVPSWASSYDGGRIILHDNGLVREDTWDDESKYKCKRQNLLRPGPACSRTYELPPRIMLEDFVEEAALRQQRCVALSRSIFSAILSLLVGMIIWEAEGPCMPLVAALFTVVGMSLSSVVQFFSTIKNKPATDAVALLSFNWFILGTLTSPTLPRVARLLAPPVLTLGGRLLRRFGFPS